MLEAMPNEFWASIIGALVGSIVGGLISYFLQRQALTEARKQRDQEASERRKALGYGIFFKMVRIYNTLESLRQHLAEGFGRLEMPELQGAEPWSVVLPIPNLPGTVHFSTDEMGMLHSLNDNSLFNDLSALDDVHNAMIELFRLHATRRASLLEKLPAHMNGTIGEIRLSIEQAMFVRPGMVELNELLKSMYSKCKQDAACAGDVLNRLTVRLNASLGLGVKIALKESGPK